MNFKDKINLLKQDWTYIFSIKSGKVIELKNKCYQVTKFIALFFDIYYGGTLVAPMFLIWIVVDEYIIHDFYISIGLSILIYLILEFIFYMGIPIKEVKCWDTYTIGRKK